MGGMSREKAHAVLATFVQAGANNMTNNIPVSVLTEFALSEDMVGPAAHDAIIKITNGTVDDSEMQGLVPAMRRTEMRSHITMLVN